MAKLVKITRDTVGPALDAAYRQLSPEGRRSLHGEMGGELARLYRRHFLGKDSGPSLRKRRSWPRQGFWEKVSQSTSLARYDDKGATVAVKDSRLASHLYGAVIRPKNAKALTIPMRAEAYGKRARTIDGLFVFTSKRTKKAFLAKREDNGALRLYYRLAQKVTIPKDPKALPPEEETHSQLRTIIDDYLADIADGLAPN